MIITIIGAGNAGSACAFMAAEAGHKVRLLKTSNRITHDDHFEAMVRNKGIYCIDNTKKGILQIVPMMPKKPFNHWN